MGVFTIMYNTKVKPKLDMAVADAVKNEVKRTALKLVEASAKQRIYDAYEPKFLSRRYSFMDDYGYDAEANGNVLTITATSALQNLYGGNHTEDLGDIIAEGWDNFNMPFPRPWMDESLQSPGDLAELERALADGMKRQGF